MKRKLPALILMISLVFSGSGCFHHEEATAWWATMLWLWWLQLFSIEYHYHAPDCGSCGSDCAKCSTYPAQSLAAPAAGPDASTYHDTAISGDGTYAAGSVSVTRTHDSGEAGAVAAGTDALLVKYGAEGDELWSATALSAPNNSCFYSVSAEGDGIYAAGAIDGNESFSFGNGVIVSGDYPGGSNILLVRYDTNGAPLWARSVTAGTGASSLYAAAAGSDGIYVSGCIAGTGTYEFGSGVTAAGAGCGPNAVIVKYDTNGTPLWARTVAAGPGDSCFHALTAEEGFVVAAGRLSGSGPYDFGDSKTATGAYPCGPGGVRVKYSADGSVQWAESVEEGDGGDNGQRPLPLRGRD